MATATVTVQAADGTAQDYPVTFSVNPPADGRPTGPAYVPIESLGNGAVTTNLRAALNNYPGNGKILTLPPNTDYWDKDWGGGNQGVFNVENGWRGIVGSGPTTRIIFPSTGFTKITPPTSGTNPYHTIQAGITSRKILELGNFAMIGNAGHLHGGIRVSSDLNATGEQLKVWGLTGDNAAPGNAWSPPGETFWVNIWRSGKYFVSGLTYEGRDNSSSPLGHNDANNGYVENVTVTGCKYGMPTWWQCDNIETHNLSSVGGHAGINQEQVGGVIRHYNTTMEPNRTNNANAMHATLQSNEPAHVASLVEFHDPVVDTGLKSGCFMLMSSKNYTVGGGTTQLQDPTKVHVYKTINGTEVQLAMQDTSVSGSAAPDVNKYWYLYR